MDTVEGPESVSSRDNLADCFDCLSPRATEIVYHGPEGLATAQTRPATLIDIGGYYKFRNPGFQLLFCYGHTAIGQTENYVYLGLYWTLVRVNGDKTGVQNKPAGAAFNGMAPEFMGRT